MSFCSAAPAMAFTGTAARSFFQLSHSGAKGAENANGALPKHPGNFTLEELDRLAAQFVFAAKKCREIGADGEEISGIDFNRRAGQRTPFYLNELVKAREGITIPLFPVGGVRENRKRDLRRPR